MRQNAFSHSLDLFSICLSISYFALQEIKYLKQLSGSKNIIDLMDSFIHQDEGTRLSIRCIIHRMYEICSSRSVVLDRVHFSCRFIASWTNRIAASKGGKSCIVMVLPYYDLDLVGAQSAFCGIREIKCAFQQILQGTKSIMHHDVHSRISVPPWILELIHWSFLIKNRAVRDAF